MAKQWIKRDFKLDTQFRMPISYIVNHLNPYDKNKVYGKENPLFEAWQSKKEKNICDKLDAGVKPAQLGPIRLNIHPTKEMFYVSDGISRIRAFKEKKLKGIEVKMGYY